MSYKKKKRKKHLVLKQVTPEAQEIFEKYRKWYLTKIFEIVSEYGTFTNTYAIYHGP
jgi:hypothetical protein